MAGNIFSLDSFDANTQPLGAKPAPKVDPKAAIDGLASKYKVPANVLLAVAEAAQSASIEQIEADAVRIAEGIKGGKDIDTLVSERFGGTDQGKAVINRAFDIADAMYPAPASAPVESEKPGAIATSARFAGEAASKGLGTAIDYAGSAIDRASEYVVGDAYRTVTGDERKIAPLQNMTAQINRGWNKAGDAIGSGISDESRRLAQGALPTGNIADPSTWKGPEDFSLEGLSYVAAQGIGSLGPVVLSAIVSRNPSTVGAVVGGAMAGGDGRQTAATEIDRLWNEKAEDGSPRLAAESDVFRDLIAKGATPDAAYQQVRTQAMNVAGDLQAIIGGAGGAVTGGIVTKGLPEAIAGKTLAGSVGRGIAASAAEEGIQEATETAAARTGINIGAGTSLNVGEGTVEAGLAGAIAGGPFGALGAKRPTQQPKPETLALPAPPLGLPAPRLALPAPDSASQEQPTPSGDGSAEGQAVAPLSNDGGLPPIDGATAEQAAPKGPIESIAAMAPDMTPQAPAPAPNMLFPEFKSGSAVQLVDPSTGEFLDATFLREETDGVVVRIGGGEVKIDPQTFDAAKKEADAVNAAVKQAPKPAPAAAPVPKPAAPVASKPEISPFDAAMMDAPPDAPIESPPPSPTSTHLSPTIAEPTPPLAATSPQVSDNLPQVSTEPTPPLQAETQQAKAAGQTDPLRAEITKAMSQPMATHTTAKGKVLTGVIVPASQFKKADADKADPYAFRKPMPDGSPGWFIKAGPAQNYVGGMAEVLPAAILPEKPAKATANAIEAAAAATNPEPTPAQAEAENYKTGKAQWQGQTLSIENAKGSMRRKVTPDGKTEWEVKMPAHYGRILGTVGADGDHVDFYMGPNPDAPFVWVIDQKHAETGKFDEHKMMIGFDTLDQATAAYVAGFSDGKGPQRLGGIEKMSAEEAAKWAKDGDTKSPVSTKMRKNGKVAAPVAAEAKNESPPKAPPSVPKVSRADQFRRRFADGGMSDMLSNPDLADVVEYGNWLGSLTDKQWKQIDGIFGSEHNPFVSAGSIDIPARRGELEAALGQSPRKQTIDAPASDSKPTKPTPAGIKGLSDAENARMAELQAKFKAKIISQINSGLDPELVTMAVEMGSLYIKAGVRRFRALIDSMMNDMGLTLEQAQPYARNAYNQIRGNMDLDGESIVDMDSDADVIAEVRKMRADAGGNQVAQIERSTPPPAKQSSPPVNVEFIDAKGVLEIGTEPSVMQYKAGGDLDGVTERLNGVTEWRSERAGMSIVYEYSDGRRVIADGHQRLGLAKRLALEGKPVTMTAIVLRESDGITQDDARVIAALKNIAEGSGTAIDAAKVMRGSKETPQQMGLPPNSAIVRDATGMRALSDQAFGMVINGVASERDGGIVGRVVSDKSAQANILGMLARMQKDRPITAFQSEQVAKQAAADTVTETQDSLFGPETDTKNLYLERAKILESANRMAREEKRAFKNVMDNADRLQAAGNQLDAGGNKARVDNATTIGDYLSREANTKGAISEALTAAARTLNGGGNIAAATRSFLAAVELELDTRGLEQGGPSEGGGVRAIRDSGRQAAGQTGSGQDADEQSVTDASAQQADAIGDMFSAPDAPAAASKDTETVKPKSAPQPAFEAGADGKPQAVMEGMEGSEAQARAGMTQRQQLEFEARQKQSKMRRLGGNDGAAGPLFDDQGDLLSDAAPQKPSKIEDFGEKIGGARKDMWGGFQDKMSAAENLDVSAEPLSKTWPEPDYEKLIEAGADAWTVGFMRAARDQAPRKPTASWKVKGWADQVTALRKFSNDVMNGKADKAKLIERLEESKNLSDKILNKVALYEAVGHSKSLKGLTFNAMNYSVKNGVHYPNGLVLWEVTREQKATIFGNMPRVVTSGKTKAEAIAGFKGIYDTLTESGQKKGGSDKGTRFIIYSQREAAGAKYKVGVKIGRNYIDLRIGIASVAEARRIVAEEHEQLQDQLDRMKDIPNERRDENAPRLGAEHRFGADITPKQFSDAFGFRGVEFGNWVEDARRQEDLNNAYDAMMDLAAILNLPPKAMSLNGTLGLAFGARGSGGKSAAAAHYEPGKVVINLTKRSGRGSLAHEWFHAADNYFAKQRTQRSAGYITDNMAPGNKVDGVRDEVVDAFSAVRRAIANTELKARSTNMDKLRSAPYWSTGIEMHARAFESYVIAKLQDLGASNDYLANTVNGSSWSMLAQISGLGDSYPYLKESELAVVRPAFDRLFDTIETRDTGTGVEMYSRFPEGYEPADMDSAVPLVSLREIAATVAQEVANAGLTGKVSPRVVRGLLGAAGVPIQGRQSGATIEVNPDSPDVVGVMRHEIIHALRDEGLWGRPYGLFTAPEWRALVKAARADKGIMARVEAAYSDLGTSAKTEEAVAELYREWASSRDNASKMGRIFAKVQSLFRAMASALRGEGFTDAAMVMERIASGEVGGRGPDGSGGMDAPQRTQDREMRDALMQTAAKAKGMIGREHWRSPSEWLTDAMSGKNGYGLLALVPGRGLFSELGKTLISAKSYLRTKEEMDSLRNDWHSLADKTAQKWLSLRRKMPRENDALMDLMHRSTQTGIDPSKRDTWRHAFEAPARQEVSKHGDAASNWAKQVIADIDAHTKAYNTLKGLYDALPKEFQEVYGEVKGNYDKLGTDFEDAVLGNIENAQRIGLKRAERAHRKELLRIKDEGLEGAERDEAIAKADGILDAIRKRGGWTGKARISALRKQFESNRLKGPYFPLARFGEYFATVRDEKGAVISFSRFENVKKQAVFVKDQEAQHPGRVSFGVMGDKGALKDQVNPAFVAEVESILAASSASNELMDAVWQKYLETLPDTSIRTAKIHRKNRAGFSEDAFRAFGKHMFHGAHQLARLKYGIILEEHMESAEEEARRADDPNRAGMIVNEMRKRHAFTMNPQGNAAIAQVSGLAFIWYLGATPAAALANLSQTTVVGPGLMAARFKSAGVQGSLSALSTAFGDFTRGKGSIEKSPTLTADEVAAVAEAVKRGTIDKTQAHDLASVAESGIEYSARREQVMRFISWFFHHAERLNREVTFLANYRLSKAEGMGQAEAIDLAADMTWKIHFDYQNTSRPRFMQNDIGKVLTVFRNFTINMLWRLFRDSHQALRGKSKEERAEARTQLIGITLSMMAHAGIKGTWGYGILMLLLGMFFPGGGDDAEKWLQDALLVEGDNLGTASWNFAMGAALEGVPGRVLGLDLTERIGMPNLWFRGAGRDLEGEDLYASYVGEILGPVFGIGQGMFRGAGLALDGEIYRGTETAVPKVVRDLMKAGRYTYEGVETKNGDTILESVNPYQILVQASGFTPAEVAERYEINSRLKNEEKRIMDDRSDIHRAAGAGIRSGKGIDPSVIAKIHDFNRRHPEYPITSDTIRQSVRSRMRASERNEFGIQLNPKLNDRLRAEQPPMIHG